MTFYTKPNDLAPATKARSVDINTLNSAVATAFAKLPPELSIKAGTVNYAADSSGAANVYAVALPAAITSYTDGLEVKIRPARDNTGPCTLNVNGLGAVPIKRVDGADPQAKDILLNAPLVLRYVAATNVFCLPMVVNSQVLQAAASATSAANSASASANSATASANSAADSAAYRSQSGDSAAASASSATLASQWASTTGAKVANSDYSAKEWALGTAVRGAAGGSAKDWASYTGGTVDGALYSARYYAEQAQAAIGSANLPLINNITDPYKIMQVKPDGAGYMLTAIRGRMFFASSF